MISGPLLLGVPIDDDLAFEHVAILDPRALLVSVSPVPSGVTPGVAIARTLSPGWVWMSLDRDQPGAWRLVATDGARAQRRLAPEEAERAIAALGQEHFEALLLFARAAAADQWGDAAWASHAVGMREEEGPLMFGERTAGDPID